MNSSEKQPFMDNTLMMKGKRRSQGQVGFRGEWGGGCVQFR